MAFDPVRDAILNSPERTSYGNPFEELEDPEQTGDFGAFKAPETSATGTAAAGAAGGQSSSRSNSRSPDRQSVVYLDVAETPGGNWNAPPTPGSAAGAPPQARSAIPRRQSSIFNLLSPELPVDDFAEDGLAHVNGSLRPSSSSGHLFEEPTQVRQQSVERPNSSTRHSLRPSLVLDNSNGAATGSSRPSSSSSSPFTARTAAVPAPARDPIKRGRPYAPFKRVNGPPPTSLHVPITPEELAFYRNPANCKNPLREGVNTASRSPLMAAARDLPRQDVKGKGKAPLAAPDDVDIAPAYAEPPPLPPSLQPQPIVRSAPMQRRRSRSRSASPSKKRKRGSTNNAPVYQEGLQVAAHYNKRQNFSREQRTYSPIIGLKSFNNWVKSVLIAKYARDYHSPPESQEEQNGRNGRRRKNLLRVLDIGCGKGGDLQKWQKAGMQEYVAVDIAEVSIQQAHKRWEELRHPRFDASFYVMDCYSYPLATVIPPQILSEPLFDVVTMQFCMHYAFQSVSKARMMLENVSRYLKTGGTFIGTIPDSEQLLTRLQELPEDANPLAFGNEVYRIVFDDRNKTPAFGHRYTFYLTDAVEDVPEYVVQWQAFENLAAEYNLKPIYHATFHELFSEERETPEFAQLLVRMKVVTPEGESELTEDQWEAANIYVAFAFVKI